MYTVYCVLWAMLMCVFTVTFYDSYPNSYRINNQHDVGLAVHAIAKYIVSLEQAQDNALDSNR